MVCGLILFKLKGGLVPHFNSFSCANYKPRGPHPSRIL
jgi:hypothetical protein